MTKFLGPVCAQSPCTAQNMALLMTSQVSEPVALRAAFRYLGVDEAYADTLDLAKMNVRPDISFARKRGLKLEAIEELSSETYNAAVRFFSHEYADMSRFLESFALLPSTARDYASRRFLDDWLRS